MFLKCQEHTNEEEYYSVVLVRKGEKMAGLVVDSFIGQQEMVLKSLGNYLSSVFAISGATILGNGKVALIIDCNALLNKIIPERKYSYMTEVVDGQYVKVSCFSISR